MYRCLCLHVGVVFLHLVFVVGIIIIAKDWTTDMHVHHFSSPDINNGVLQSDVVATRRIHIKILYDCALKTKSKLLLYNTTMKPCMVALVTGTSSGSAKKKNRRDVAVVVVASVACWHTYVHPR
jgi:hypothetical protein